MKFKWKVVRGEFGKIRLIVLIKELICGRFSCGQVLDIKLF